MPWRKAAAKVVAVSKTEEKEEPGLDGAAHLSWISRKSVRLCRAGSCPSLFSIFIINLGNGMENTFVKLTGDISQEGLQIPGEEEPEPFLKII